MPHDPESMAELSRLSNAQLCDRLRGVYRIPITDGAGPLNGSNEFVRTFETGTIQHEAAHRIQQLADLIVHMNVHAGYRKCGYAHMTTEQKALYESVWHESIKQ